MSVASRAGANHPARPDHPPAALASALVVLLLGSRSTGVLGPHRNRFYLGRAMRGTFDS